MKRLYHQQISLIKALDSSKIEPLDTNSPNDLTALDENFCPKHEASIELPPIVNDIILRDAVKRFQDHTADAIKLLDHICYYYSCFVNPAQLKHISEINPIIMAVFDTAILPHHNLHCYGYDSESFDFCCVCWNRIKKAQLPKFGIFNKIRQLYCQYYPLQSNGFITAKEVVIVKAYLIITILKLRPNNKFNPRSYWAIQAHFMLPLQNP